MLTKPYNNLHVSPLAHLLDLNFWSYLFLIKSYSKLRVGQPTKMKNILNKKIIIIIIIYFKGFGILQKGTL